MNGKHVIKKLQSAGWQLDRINGSHHILTMGNKTISVPVHGAKDISKGLLSRIAKQTGVKL
jgi:predicted RNA binding protein YcfA (HicA-like mRNA interferase family)